MSDDGVSEISNCRLIVIDSCSTKRQYLVDTGAEISVVPPTSSEKKFKTDFKLYAANATPIETYGKKTINLNIGLRRSFPWQFTIANVDRCIIGADFLTNYDILVDIKNKKLIDSQTLLSVEGISVVTQPFNISTLQTSMFAPQISKILSNFKSVLHETLSLNV